MMNQQEIKRRIEELEKITINLTNEPPSIFFHGYLEAIRQVKELLK